MITSSVIIAFLGGSIGVGGLIAGIRLLTTDGGVRGSEEIATRSVGRPHLRVCN
jgi:hypothetical protein